MKRIFKSLAVLLTVVIAVVSFGGCSKSNVAQNKKVTITYEYWGSTAEIQQNGQIIDAFEAKYPDITVKQISAPWASYFTKIQTQFSSGTAPDVMFMTYISTYASLGVLRDMTPLFNQYKFDISKYPKGLVDSFTVGGKTYGVPRDNDTKVVYYNKKLFANSNVAVPTRGWTTDQFVTDAQQLTKTATGGIKQYGLLFDPGSWYLYTSMNQGQLFDNNEKPTKVTMDSANTVNALQFVGDLINKYKVTPSYASLNDGTIRTQMFVNNQAAMLIDNAAQLPTFAAATNLSWDVAYLPVFSGKPEANVGGGAGYTIYAKTQQLDASWKLWEFLNTTGVKMDMESSNICPANEDLLNSSSFLSDKYNAKVFVDETKAAVSLPTAKCWWNVYSAASPFLESVWTGGSSASDAIQKAMPELTKQLNS